MPHARRRCPASGRFSPLRLNCVVREPGIISARPLLTKPPPTVGRKFVTLGRDRIVKLWDWRKQELLASLVVQGDKEWLAVAPDGRFDGTPAGWSKIFWRFGQDIFSVEPIEIFFQEFFYPNLLSDISTGRLPPPSQNPAQKDRRQPRVALAPANSGVRAVSTNEVSEFSLNAA